MDKHVIVASKNPVKIDGVKNGFKKVFLSEDFIFEGVSVSSGVKDQPMSNEETIKGAMNRATNAKAQYQNANYWVGIEGGVEKVNNEMEVFAWVVILSSDNIGKARTGTFFLPNKVVELIDAGKELGDADDIVFGYTNSKQENGSIGILTKGVVTRKDIYTETVILALIPFNNTDIF